MPLSTIISKLVRLNTAQASNKSSNEQTKTPTKPNIPHQEKPLFFNIQMSDTKKLKVYKAADLSG
jgi:hypothetical protein